MDGWSQRILLILLHLLTCSIAASSRASAQWGDSFEGGEPRWQLVESDCQAQLTEHGMSAILPHGGQASEMFEVACTHGTMALLAYPIEPCAILNEFQPRIWTRCSSGRIQLGVRVVYPHAAHPVTGGRVSTILWGDWYRDTGQWQMLQVKEMAEQIQDENVALRQRFGSEIKLDGAYIDCLVLNAYTGPGRYRVQLDDLDLRGIIPMASIGIPPPVDWREQWRWRYRVPTAEERFWSSPNHPPLLLQHRGESLAWVDSLGFSGVVVDRLPSEDWLRKLNQFNLSVISPPPDYAVEFAEELRPAIKGWLIGAALDSRQTAVAKQQAERVAQLPPNLRRPLVAEAMEEFFLYSRVADELIVPTLIPSSAGQPELQLSWLSHKLDTTRQRSEGWVSINVGIPPTLERQMELARATLEPHAADRVISDPLGLRAQATSAILAGARGILFRTFKPLDIQTPAGSAQVAAIRWINSDLRLWGPWVVAGQDVQPPHLNVPEWKAVAWKVAQSHLIVAQHIGQGSQYCTRPTRRTPIEFAFATSTPGQQVFRLTHGQLTRVQTEVSPVGMEWSLEDPTPVESFLVTSNPTVIKYVRETLAKSAEQRIADQLEIVSYTLGHAADVSQARFRASPDRSGPSASPEEVATMNLLAGVQRQLDSAWNALRANQITEATDAMYEASDVIQTVLYAAHLEATSNLSVPQSSPFVVTPGALAIHWKLAAACERSQWYDLAIPGGEFHDLGQMLQVGWTQQRRLEERVDLRVELVPSRTSGATGLRMAAYAKPENVDDVAGGYEGASLRIRSASATVEAGQLVRISARAHVLREGKTPGSGLLVYDNQVGPTLGQLVNGQAGDEVRIELYRFISEDGEFRLLAECRGECDIVLDSVRASVITPATNRTAYPTSRLDALPSGSTIISNEQP